MSSKNRNNDSISLNRPGIALLVTLVLLVVLSTLGYSLTSRLAARRHRNQYIIDYHTARYACDSAAKYALASLQELTPHLISRPNEPDFSDLFALSEAEYKQLLADWAAELSAGQSAAGTSRNSDDTNDPNYDTNDVNYTNPYDVNISDFNDPNFLTIRGPYGPTWPFIAEPVEFEIGSATVRIEIEDENAKYPLGWALLTEKELQREALAGFETFCEWMNLDYDQIDSLKEQLKEISEIKPFKLKFEPIIETTKAKAPRRTQSRARRTRRRTRTIKKTIPASVHTTDFVKLFHSSMIDTELLARPTVISDTREESPLKYMGLWASAKVNVNTAPRHVLEAALTFGGDADKIAEEIIRRRHVKPFADIEDLRKVLLRYSDSIEKCEKYIMTASNLFTIKVTAVSGVAKASTVIAVTKDNKKLKRIAVTSG